MHFTRNGAFGPGGKPLLVLERGEGSYVFDTDGKVVAKLSCIETSGWACRSCRQAVISGWNSAMRLITGMVGFRR